MWLGIKSIDESSIEVAVWKTRPGMGFRLKRKFSNLKSRSLDTKNRDGKGKFKRCIKHL